ncbi:MAG: peptidase M24, structural domain-containing protein [Benjaminiella poitrasii]|nr:MAG: peptidase M24, structural domain-containing protein [Benjaminiella poitrasii]
MAGYHIVLFLDLDEIYLVQPTVSPYEQLWKGTPDTAEKLLERYDVDHIITETELSTKLLSDVSIIYTLDITDTSLIPSQLESCIDKSLLKAAIDESRLTKSPWEISLLKYSAHISSHAHMALMTLCGANTKLPLVINEAELEARFRWICARNGLSRQCYIPIIASGPRAAILHYTNNDKAIPINDPHTLVLVDAGGEYKCYGSDVTRTFPFGGKFSDEAKTIYNIVLSAQNAVLKCIRPGIYWRDMHNLVVRMLSRGLIQTGILVGHEDEIIQFGIYRAFYFHGTGHSVGLDCHDVEGIYSRKGFPLELLDNRPLEENMVITVEPGLYFNDVSIRLWTENPVYQKYFNMQRLNRYRVVGGVRIEDTILITSDGHENLTIVPKEIDDIEALMRQ